MKAKMRCCGLPCKKVLRAACALMTGVACCLSAAGQDGSFLFRGTVKDFRSEKIILLPDVQVYTNHNPKGSKTDKNGQFSLNVNKGDSVFTKKKGFTYWADLVDDAFIAKNRERARSITLCDIENTISSLKVKEIIVDGHLYPAKMMYSIPIDIEFWAFMGDPQERISIIFQSEKNKDGGISRWILVQEKDTVNAIKYLQKRDWALDE
jgi:hypothetical protein